ncbi:dephospho-CoA kinase [Pararhizobium sp. IMCC21322]|uniref:dephospho-CoA kinase n=1 Tax=Pararhizobium sp. IMCC21322 TaxID=3067903 RepID=UPI00274066E6|nr:dephospho-CoA kinase [Pararhizobium sp. IMCC21322]
MTAPGQNMLVLGLTGSIGMGKSTTANLFHEEGVPVFDADAAVHDLYQGAAVPEIGKRFPNAVKNGIVDRAALAQSVIGHADALADLEKIIHPLVRAAELDFIQHHRDHRSKFVLLDIPLLFESGGDALCDKIIVVTAPADVQRERVLARDGMTPEKYDGLLARQMSDADKRAKADFIVFTDKGIEDARQQIRKVLQNLNA